MNERVDVAIVGGGIAGSSLAAVLARAGRSVVVIEREPAFRDRVRGEGIHPWGVAEIYSLGLEHLLTRANANPLPIWQSYIDRLPESPFEWSEASVSGLPEYGVFHPRLQDAAIGAARGAGAKILRPATVVGLKPGSPPEVDVLQDDRRQTISARLVVGADGKTSAIRSWAGIGSSHDPVHHRIGGALFDNVELTTDAAHEARFSGGRVFTLPHGGGRARTYIITAPDCHLKVQRDRTGKRVIDLLASLYPEGSWTSATLAGPIAFFPNADRWADRIATDGVVLIGDAAGANDPSVGNGLSLVFRDVRELRDLLLGGDNWPLAIQAFAGRRSDYFEVVRQHAIWLGILVTEVGAEADARRERVERAREIDPTAGGFTLIFARGPEDLVADNEARRRFFGEIS